MKPRSPGTVARALGALLLLIIGFAGGFFFHRSPSYLTFRTWLVEHVRGGPEAEERYTAVSRDYLETDPSRLISVTSREELVGLRENLTRFIFGPAGLPRDLRFVSEEHDWRDDRYASLEGLRRLDRLTVRMQFGIESVVYRFVPETPNRTTVLYHQGHGGDFILARELIEALVEEGYTVMGLSMPLLGMNNRPTVTLPRFGRIKLDRHEVLRFLEPEAGHPVRFLLEPIIACLNHLEAEAATDRVAMVGLSGGGWSTTLAAALDPRIRISVPVAGSIPLYLRSGGHWGEWEESIPELYERAGYLELYLLGALEVERTQLQLLNQFDPCCFWGVTAETYAPVIRDRLASLGGGRWELHIDGTHREHEISAAARESILELLEEAR